MNEAIDLSKARRSQGCDNTPEDVLRRALDKLESGERWAGRSKLIVVCVDDSDGQYDLGFIAANLKASEIIALADLLKSDIRHSMGY